MSKNGEFCDLYDVITPIQYLINFNYVVKTGK